MEEIAAGPERRARARAEFDAYLDRLVQDFPAIIALAYQGRHGQDVECTHGQLHQGDGQPIADEAHEGHALPLGRADAHGHDIGRGPDQGGVAPRVAPNIMAMNTGSVAVGQSVKPAARATSRNASAATRYPLVMMSAAGAWPKSPASAAAAGE